MMSTIRGAIVLSIYPNVSGLGYAVFEGSLVPVDWGIKTARKAKYKTLMRHVAWLLRFFNPAAIVLPSRSTFMDGSRRLQKVADDIALLAERSGINVHWYSRADIRECFKVHKAKSKDAIARAIARLMPEFEQHVPPARRLWMSEDYRMGIFDAVALAVTFYTSIEERGC